jgi:hypothetical protein
MAQLAVLGNTSSLPVELARRKWLATRHLIPSTSFKYTPCAFLVHGAPLVEEKGHMFGFALIENVADSFFFLHSASFLPHPSSFSRSDVQFAV